MLVVTRPARYRSRYCGDASAFLNLRQHLCDFTQRGAAGRALTRQGERVSTEQRIGRERVGVAVGVERGEVFADGLHVGAREGACEGARGAPRGEVFECASEEREEDGAGASVCQAAAREEL